MDIQSLMQAKMKEVEERQVPSASPRPQRSVEPPPVPDTLIKVPGGYPSTEDGMSLAYPPTPTAKATITYRVHYLKDLGPKGHEPATDDYQFTINSSLGPIGYFWWHLPALLASSFIGRGSTHCVRSVEILEVKEA